MSVRDVPILGQITVATSLLLDLLLSSGDLLIGLVWAMIGNVEIVLSIVIMLNRLTDTVPWLPDGIVEKVATMMFALMLVVYLGRLVTQIGENE